MLQCVHPINILFKAEKEKFTGIKYSYLTNTFFVSAAWFSFVEAEVCLLGSYIMFTGE